MTLHSLTAPGGLRLGLGCSKFGSLNGVSPAETRLLLSAALDAGFRVFDTSNVYGQGDSERLIGRALGQRDDSVVISKAGKYLPPRARLLSHTKWLLRPALRRVRTAREITTTSRQAGLPSNWDAHHLSKSLEGTLRRLGRERVEVFLLHSPAIDVVLAGEAIGALDRAREEGKVGWIGVSVDEPGTAAAALADERVQVLEIPLHPGTTNFLGIVHDAHERGVAIVAREILGGKTALASTADPAAFASARISEVVDDASITLPLVGATRIQTVIASAEAARRDADNGSGLR